ncbi:glycosyltransferase [Peribacillus butanolivorans]
MKKICLLVSSNVIDDPRVRKSAKLAAQNDFDVTAIGRYDINKEQTYSTFDEFKISTIKIFKKGNGVISRIWERFLFSLHMYKECVKVKPDVIHANDFDTLPFGYLAAKRVNAKLIYDAHEIFTENGMVVRYPFFKKFAQVLEKKLIKQSDQFISVSHSSAEQYAKMYNIPKPNVITNCPFRLEIIPVEKSKTFEVLCHGQFVADRGYEELIISQTLLPIEKVKIKLRGFGEYKQFLLQIAEENEVDKHIFAESVSVTEVVSKAAKSHVGVVLTKPISLNYKLTVSNKLFEYINAGLPVIMSNVDEHRYLNELYNFGLIIDEVNPNEIKKAILRLYEDEELYNTLKTNAIKASKSLNWEVEGEKLIKLYSKN